jgi:hypothetical protein
MNFFHVDRQQTICIINLCHAIALRFDLYVMRQRGFSFSYSLTILIVCFVLSHAWLAWLFHLNIRHVVLVIVKLQGLLMMSRNGGGNV